MLLIIESGSTKTEWRYMTQPDQKYESFFSSGINPYYQSADEITTSQKSSLAWLENKQIQEIYYYGTGITDEEKKQSICHFLKPFIPASAKITVENDLVGAARALCGEQKGIACILGTGSNSGYFDGQSIVEQIPPLGFWLGDEGSGGHLGKLLILSYLHLEMPTDVREMFIKRFGSLSRLDILSKAYQGEYPNRWFATFSKFLFDHRKNPFCYQIIENSLNDFCELYILKYPTVKDTTIHFTGSVGFYFSDILKRVLLRHQLKIGHISEGPMAGLCLYHKNKTWPTASRI